MSKTDESPVTAPTDRRTYLEIELSERIAGWELLRPFAVKQTYPVATAAFGG